MLKQLHIKNFQSHNDTLLEFSSGVNVIVGKSDSGKSACLRAILWALNNRPLGDSFIRQGQDRGAEVDLVFDDNVQVKRFRSKSKNTYDLKSDVFQGSFASFGQSPPSEVVTALNLSDINTQGQFSPSFLVFDPPGTVADYLRKITGMEKLDKAADLTAQNLRATKAKLTIQQEELKEVEEKLQSIGSMDLNSIELLLQEATNIEGQHKSLQANIIQIKQLVQLIRELQQQEILLDAVKIGVFCVEAKRLIGRCQRKVEESLKLARLWFQSKTQSLRKWCCQNPKSRDYSKRQRNYTHNGIVMW